MILQILYFLFRASLFFVVLRSIYKWIIKPFLILEVYKKQGLVSESVTDKPKLNFPQEIITISDFNKTLIQKVISDPRPQGFVRKQGSLVEVVLFDPELIKSFYLGQEFYDHSVRYKQTFKDLLPTKARDTTIDERAKKRKLMSFTFNFDYIKEMIPELLSITKSMLPTLQNDDGNKKVKLARTLRMISGELIGRIFFGDHFQDNNIVRAKHIGRIISKLLKKLYQENNNKKSFFSNIPSIETRGRIKEFREYVQNLFDSKLNQIKNSHKAILEPRRRDIVELLVEQNLKYPANSLTFEEIVDEFVSCLIFGVDQMTSLILRTLYFLNKFEDCKHKVEKEIEDNFSNLNNFSLNKLNKMEYTSAVIKEVLRMAPPQNPYSEKQARTDHGLGDLIIKKDTIVTPGTIANNFDPNYHKDPDDFVPERWLSASLSQMSIRNHPYFFSPFAGGLFSCVGQQLALVESKIIIGLILQNADVKNREDRSQLKIEDTHDNLKFIFSAK